MMLSRRIESRGRSLFETLCDMGFLPHSELLGPTPGLLIDREGGPSAPLPSTLISPGLISMAWISRPAHQLVPCPAHAAIGGLGPPVSYGPF